ncbi:zinc finger protein 830 isoform X1 [Juglans microcarpa x Juglans regia]|uniref:zinc finger protein 830 isoform X1 n=1 Tax=Juglans microcarpa x Juglans regia TaxID=2249226 RepID=UPI001B7EE630|nr:zinc finger protein 830 isoform X1 [Juglans microcarpa x Juglans regia]
MDAQARKKALFRAKLNAQKKDKRIDSPLVRYNELEQPVCRVCDIVLKSESLWDAHQASRKHHEAINSIKASAAGLTRVSNAKSEPHKELSKVKPEQSTELHIVKPECSMEVPKRQSSAVLPPDFFDNSEAKRLKTGKDSVKSLEPDLSKKMVTSAQPEEINLAIEIDKLPSANVAQDISVQSAGEHTTSVEIAGLEIKQVKGALPEGFFDNKEADLRARGIKLVKPDIKDEYKEFEKLIQEDLQEVDDRFEEEEIDAAEMIEEAESVEQKAYREKVEMLRKKKLELQVARSSKHGKASEVVGKESNHDESSSDDDSDENFAVDWRAQHL